MTPFADGVWLASSRCASSALCLSATMALLRLGGVVVGHGVPLAAGAREALAAAYAWLS